MNPEKLAKLQEQVRIGGKDSIRRKMKKSSGKLSGDDKKVGASLKKVGLQSIPGIDEVNFFQDDETVLHFGAPKGSNTIINSFLQSKRQSMRIRMSSVGSLRTKVSSILNFLLVAIDLTELAPGIIEQLSPESLDRLRQMANAYLQMTQNGANLSEENIPQLIEKFESQSVSESNV